MLIDQLSPRYGSTKSGLTADERNLALKIGGVGLQPDAEHTIIDVQVQLKNIKLQVNIKGTVRCSVKLCIKKKAEKID